MSYKGWDKLIEEFKASGKSQAQWCREKDLIDSWGIPSFIMKYLEHYSESIIQIYSVNI